MEDRNVSRYTKLKEDYDFLKKQNELLEKEVDHRWDNIHSLQEEVKTLKDQLMEAKLELGKTNAKLQSVINSNKTNSDVIQYLAARRFGDDPTIEFAAIKTYRGWETLYLHGEELNPAGKNVTVWADQGDPVSVEVTSA